MRGPYNWWKIGFFIALFAFEVAREIAVISAYHEAQPSGPYRLFNGGDLIVAEGRWKRADKGSELFPAAIRIECWRSKGICLEAYTRVYSDLISPPEIDWFDANFSSDAVVYENTQPMCANYSVRIDLKLKKVFAVRDKKSDGDGEFCGALEDRIGMQLSDGYEYRDPTKGHFVPIIKGLMALAQALEKHGA